MTRSSSSVRTRGVVPSRSTRISFRPTSCPRTRSCIGHMLELPHRPVVRSAQAELYRPCPRTFSGPGPHTRSCINTMCPAVGNASIRSAQAELYRRARNSLTAHLRSVRTRGDVPMTVSGGRSARRAVRARGDVPIIARPLLPSYLFGPHTQSCTGTERLARRTPPFGSVKAELYRSRGTKSVRNEVRSSTRGSAHAEMPRMAAGGVSVC